jgi:hypothetical protein
MNLVSHANAPPEKSPKINRLGELWFFCVNRGRKSENGERKIRQRRGTTPICVG